MENGVEFTLTPLSARKNNFVKDDYFMPKPTKDFSPQERTSSHNKIDIKERVISSNIPYIEEEKDVLKNINIVQSLKSKFMD